MARPISKIFYSSDFEKNFVRLPKHIQKLAKKKDLLFREDAFNSALETHKLGGKLQNDWAYSINKDYRVQFYFINKNTAMYLNVGTHEIYKQ